VQAIAGLFRKKERPFYKARYTVSSSGADCKSVVEKLGWGSSNPRHHRDTCSNYKMDK